jgi:hypothetical protein
MHIAHLPQISPVLQILYCISPTFQVLYLWLPAVVGIAKLGYYAVTNKLLLFSFTKIADLKLFKNVTDLYKTKYTVEEYKSDSASGFQKQPQKSLKNEENFKVILRNFKQFKAEHSGIMQISFVGP